MPQLYYYRHKDGGAVHGFTMPLPPEIEAQVQLGRLVPCPEPTQVNTLQLSDEQIAELRARDVEESVEDKRARLLAELAALDAAAAVDDAQEGEQDPPSGSTLADELPGGDDLSTPAKTARGGRRSG